MSNIEHEELIFKILEGNDINKEDALTIYSFSNSNLLYFMYLSTNIVFTRMRSIISHSKNVFIPITNLCRNNCSYCGFRKPIEDNSSYILKKEKILQIAKRGVTHNCKEALFTFGERPETKFNKIKKELNKWGYLNIIEYLQDLCEEVIKIGLFPHSNPGILEKEELKLLKDINASLGLMLENSSNRLCSRGGPHEFSPGKVPKLRIRTIELAGKLKIPFTTGILVGIGETEQERIESLLTIKKIHEKYNHIQEVIIQNFIPQKNTPMESHPPPNFLTMLKTIIIARLIFRDKMNIQAPPNLNPRNLSDLLLSGINDWGGISPVTHDFINPDMSWPKISELQRITENFYFKFKERLPIYPAFINDKFLPKFLKDQILSVVDEQGYIKE
ncbi:MAG: 7,8-didemethyl-8-hydroxy-5-deazariboflavin synthase CofG [Promethearchaeota archaeon]